MVWVGPEAEAPSGGQKLDVGGGILMPGLIDCHSHLVFAGSRLGDFLKRMGGESYEALLSGGGGIHTTVAATKSASDAELLALTQGRLARLAKSGVMTVEVKSGYGLEPEAEARLLTIAGEAARAPGMPKVVRTFLGAHALPPGRDRKDYVAEVVGAQLAACKGLAERIDVYCDRGAFTVEEAEQILRAGQKAGLGATLHAEQVAWTGAAELAGRLNIQSADHLERVDEAGIAALAKGGVVAVLLPGAMLQLRDSSPPVMQLRAAGVPMAVATDFNPGSSPVLDVWLVASLAVLTMGLTPEEALKGITRVGAQALGLKDRGRIEVGAVADLAVFEPPSGEKADPRTLLMYMGGHTARIRIQGGRVLADSYQAAIEPSL
jgi:imidazolonepropionase